MSSSINVYSLDLTRLDSAPASCDNDLLEACVRRDPERLSRHDQYFKAAFPQTGEFLTLSEALRQIIFGSIDTTAVPRFQFEHAVTFIVAVLGEKLDSEFFSDTKAALWDEIDEAIHICASRSRQPIDSWPRLALVLSRGPSISVPLDRQARLGTGYLTATETVEAARAARATRLSGNHVRSLEWPEEALEGARVYRSWLLLASKRGQGIFMHC